MSEKAKRAAGRVLISHGVTRVTLDTLIQVFNDLNCEVIDLDPDSPDILISRLALPETVTAQDAFVYRNRDMCLVFVNEQLEVEERVYAFSHELGHILLGHLENSAYVSGVRQEYEASEFVHYLLNPPLSVRLRAVLSGHRRLVLGICAALLCVMLGLGIWQHTRVQDSFFGEYYVTRSGTRYHVKDCIMIRNKTNVRRLTKEEVSKYQPCSICMPGGE